MDDWTTYEEAQEMARIDAQIRDDRIAELDPDEWYEMHYCSDNDEGPGNEDWHFVAKVRGSTARDILRETDTDISRLHFE